MTTILDALYNWAESKPDQTRWLGHEDFVQEYKESARFMENNDVALESVLSGKELALFKRYKDNRDLCEDLHSEMVFAQGVAIGVSLGSLRP